MQALTSRQQQVLDFIQLTHLSSGVAPSLREIARQFGFRSMTAAADHVRALRRKGYLVHHPRRARAHAIPAGMRVRTGSVVPIPIYGAATGDRTEPPDSIFVDLDALGVAGSETLFAVHVHGQAMKMVLDGDIAILDWAVTPSAGDVVAMKVGNGYVLRTFALDEAGLGVETSEGLPDGPGNSPLDEKSVAQGVLVGLIRRYR